MSGCRQTKNVWWYLFGFYSYSGNIMYRWRGRELLKRNFWRFRKYIWHDSVGKFWNRFILCPLLGHKKVVDISESWEDKELHCFKCEQRVKE